MKCPKCGSESGWNGPTYRGPDFSPGYGPVKSIYWSACLVFECRTCRYQRTEPTKDAPPEPPPPPPPNKKIGGFRNWIWWK